MQRASVSTRGFNYDDTKPEGYRSGVALVGEAAGGEALAVKAYEVPAGQSVFPYHYEYVEEWLVVLEGSIVIRTPGGEEELGSGQVVCFAIGPRGAHKVTNRGEATARILMFSSAEDPAVAVYPDSDKIGVWAGDADDEFMLRRADANVDFWDGER